MNESTRKMCWKSQFLCSPQSQLHDDDDDDDDDEVQAKTGTQAASS